MKHITINLNNTRTNNNTKSFTPSNASALLDDIIAAGIKEANPLLFGSSNDIDDLSNLDLAKILGPIKDEEEPKKKIKISINLNKNAAEKKDSHITLDENRDIVYDDFFGAMNNISKHITKFGDADYELPDGTPVSIEPFGLLIGCTYIPFDDKKYEYYFNRLSPIAKKTIISISIKLNK